VISRLSQNAFIDGVVHGLVSKGSALAGASHLCVTGLAVFDCFLKPLDDFGVGGGGVLGFAGVGGEVVELGAGALASSVYEFRQSLRMRLLSGFETLLNP
jgi:hypothetical protein